MKLSLDREALRARIELMTMEEARMGNDDPDQTVVGYYAEDNFSFDPLGDGGNLDDALRLLLAVQPFGKDVVIDYRWAGEANDERYTSIVFRIATPTSSVPSAGQFLEVGLLGLGQFAGGSVIDAVEQVAVSLEDAYGATAT